MVRRSGQPLEKGELGQGRSWGLLAGAWEEVGKCGRKGKILGSRATESGAILTPGSCRVDTEVAHSPSLFSPLFSAAFAQPLLTAGLWQSVPVSESSAFHPERWEVMEEA